MLKISLAFYLSYFFLVSLTVPFLSNIQALLSVSTESIIIYPLIFNISQFNYPPMKYLAAYALLALSGKTNISAADIKKVLGGVQATVSDDDINRVIESLKGKKVHQLIAQGVSGIGSSAPAASVQAKEVKKEEPKKKEQVKKEAPPPPPEEDEDDMMGVGLFD